MMLERIEHHTEVGFFSGYLRTINQLSTPQILRLVSFYSLLKNLFSLHLPQTQPPLTSKLSIGVQTNEPPYTSLSLIVSSIKFRSMGTMDVSLHSCPRTDVTESVLEGNLGHQLSR